MKKEIFDNKYDYYLKTKNLIDYIDSAINDEMLMKNFFSNLEIEKVNDNEVFIKFGNEKITNFIKENYFYIIKDGIKQIFLRDLNVIYLTKQDKKTNFDSDDINKIDKIINKKTNFENFINKKFTFENLVECDFNKDVLRAIKNVYKQEEIIFNPIFIHSNSGLGKTHLLHALGNEILKESNKSVVYINPDLITQKMVFLMQKGNNEELENLKSFYKNADVLLFDDVQNYKNKEVILKIVFDIINNSLEQQKQIVICSDKKPDELGGFEQRFITRFKSGLTLGMKKASINDLKTILKFLVIKEKLNPDKWEEESYEFVAKNHSNSIRDLIGALNKVKFYSNDFAKNTPYSYLVLKNIFSDLKLDKNNINEDKIISIVTKYYKISKSDLISKSRIPNIVLARDITMWLIRNVLELTFEKIGEIFNNRTHSAVITSINRINQKLINDANLKNILGEIENKINNFE
ncbi:chromosomal replication initiator protein DnaA [[Mycoplasma] mobile]|uniref:Chromosomal replication initiator protein DnaA n=1 Tax=Mycoplasma mobile (strain ATCC 43663 / 163K / NCTC 11711) TaxID=267748 RepID=Q6KIT7_MYCM1|nr:chromosomal replication initiator protein DnaA [[Mycoplasma] mobile]AAT27487.1 chromosomal replication initiator protein [Mycoplasma mobile 163K]